MWFVRHYSASATLLLRRSLSKNNDFNVAKGGSSVGRQRPKGGNVWVEDAIRIEHDIDGGIRPEDDIIKGDTSVLGDDVEERDHASRRFDYFRCRTLLSGKWRKVDSLNVTDTERRTPRKEVCFDRGGCL